MKKHIFTTVILLLIFLSSCSEYQKIFKSTDPEFKYDKAVEYFSKGKYTKAISIFEDVANYYKNTDRSEMIISYMAKSYIEQKDYYSAKSYYEAYVKSFPKGQYVEESKFMLGYCDYMQVPDVRLDQSTTILAISEFQNFIEQFPDSERSKDAAKKIDELNDKLAEKELINADLYYNLGIYLGNNYLSAVITADNALKKFPSTKYREEFIYLMLKGKYQQALYSTDQMKYQRYQDVIDEYYSYANEFPKGKYIKKANNILKSSKHNIPAIKD